MTYTRVPKMTWDVFWSRVDKSGDCWQWTGRVESTGYAKAGRWGHAHVVAYENAHGPVPDGKVLDHLCRNRSCVNPDHLEPVTHRENLLRGPATHAARNAAKTHCPKGHEYAGDNVRIKVWVNKRGDIRRKRACRKCAAEESARSYAQRRVTKPDSAG